LVEVVGIDSLPPAAHRFAAPFGRPKRAAPRFVNPLRGFSSQPLPTNKKTALRRFFSVGGGGGNRTPARRYKTEYVRSVTGATNVAGDDNFRMCCVGKPTSFCKFGPCQSAGPWNLVEVVGIEPTSASPTLRDLHAYTVFNLTAGYPTGREDSQPVQ